VTLGLKRFLQLFYFFCTFTLRLELLFYFSLRPCPTVTSSPLPMPFVPTTSPTPSFVFYPKFPVSTVVFRPRSPPPTAFPISSLPPRPALDYFFLPSCPFFVLVSFGGVDHRFFPPFSFWHRDTRLNLRDCSSPFSKVPFPSFRNI